MNNKNPKPSTFIKGLFFSPKRKQTYNEQLADAISKQFEIPLRISKNFLNAFGEEITSVLAKEKYFKLAHIGIFLVEKTKTRKTKNIHTKKTIIIPETWRIKFRISAELKKKVVALYCHQK